MRIAVIAPLIEPVPPPRYGGTERVVSVLTEELVRRGHQVTLFASGDSATAAELLATCPRGLRLDPEVKDYVALTLIHAGEVYRQADQFDVIHNHVDYIAFPFARLCSVPTVTTTHGRLDLPEIRRVYESFPKQHLVSISHAQRDPVPLLNWIGNVYNAIDLSSYHLHPEPGDYLIFLGRICPEKRPDRAIEVALSVGMRLVIAAKVDPLDQEYYEHAIAPLIESSVLIEYIGEITEQEKDEVLGKAYASLHSIDFPEPFGLTIAEAMATGTPVITMRRGSTPEVVADGVTGFVCDSIGEMIAAVEQIPRIDRRACRARVEQHFSPAAMVDSYERVYADVIGARQAVEHALLQPPLDAVVVSEVPSSGARI